LFLNHLYGGTCREILLHLFGDSNADRDVL
jgi:hypothetical protein